MSSVWSSRALQIACLCTAVAIAACSSDKSKAPQASGGDASDGPSGSGNSDSGGTDSGGPGEPGDFGAIWRRASAELTLIDATNPAATKSINLDIPNKVTHDEYETDVELFEQIKDDQLIVYAHYEDAEIYYRVVTPLQKADDTYILQSGAGLSGMYSLEDGVLKLSQTQATETKVVLSETLYENYAGDFPPADWPTEVVELEGATP
jgi:hypothetical protein